MRDLVLGLVGILVLAGAWYLFYPHMHTAPDHAKILYDGANSRYASPPCVLNGDVEGPYIQNPEDIRDSSKALILEELVREMAAAHRVEFFPNAKPDRRCANAEGFVQSISVFAEWAGWQSRWTSAGDWRW